MNTGRAYEAAGNAGADWVGFVFFDRSPRCITPAEAAGLIHLGAGPQHVGLFVDPTDGELSRALDAVPLAALQLYVSTPRLHEIFSRFAIPLWHAIGVTTAKDLPPDSSPAAAFVIEPKPPADADRPGGLARRLDWQLLAGWTPTKPWLLAGGLTPDNVSAAIDASGASAVDVSSGVESSIGVKDPDLIERFVLAARSASRKA